MAPMTDLPTQWKVAADAPWQPAQPSDDLPKGDWWQAYGDAQLDALERSCLQGNYGLQAAVARLDAARAQSRVHEAALLPSVSAGATAGRSRISANRPLANYNVPNEHTVQNEFRPVVGVSYEFDWLGKLRLDVQGALASAEQAQADMENVRLLLAAEVASRYFALRQLDEEIAVVTRAIGLQDKVVDLIQRRYKAGASAQADLAQQIALTQASKAQLELLKLSRAEQEDALATLTASPAAQFRLAPARLPATVPSVPVAMPSRLLERRPDIASAERAVAAANAQVGVARAAYYPVLTLAPTLLGADSNVLSTLAQARSAIWAFGLSATQPLFDAGRNDALVDTARANRAATVANYRQAVLTAIQELQDALTGLQQLGVAQQRQDDAVTNQNKAYQIGLVRYQEGLDNSVTLATTEQNQLSAQRVQSQIRGSQFQASVALIKALGGGWTGLAMQP